MALTQRYLQPRCGARAEGPGNTIQFENIHKIIVRWKKKYFYLYVHLPNNILILRRTAKQFLTAKNLRHQHRTLRLQIKHRLEHQNYLPRIQENAYCPTPWFYLCSIQLQIKWPCILECCYIHSWARNVPGNCKGNNIIDGNKDSSEIEWSGGKRVFIGGHEAGGEGGGGKEQGNNRNKEVFGQVLYVCTKVEK